MNEPTHENGWREWSKHVLNELKRQNEWLSGIQRSVNQINVEIAVLKLKSGAWGMLGGLLAVAVALGVGWIRGK